MNLYLAWMASLHFFTRVATLPAIRPLGTCRIVAYILPSPSTANHSRYRFRSSLRRGAAAWCRKRPLAWYHHIYQVVDADCMPLLALALALGHTLEDLSLADLCCDMKHCNVATDEDEHA